MTEQNLTDSLGYRQHPAIANSDLKYLYNPKLFKLNKERQLEQDSTEAQDNGNIIDMYLLERTLFDNTTHILTEPLTSPNSPNKENFVRFIIDGNDVFEAYLKSYKVSKKDLDSGDYKTSANTLYNELKDYIDVQIIAKEKQIITSEMFNMLINIELSIANHVLANKLFFDPDKGWEVYKQLEITDVEYNGIYWKGKLDLAIVDHIDKVIYNIDLKSTKGQNYFVWDYKKYKYYRQQALYEILLSDKFKHLVEKGYVIKTRVVSVEKSFPYETRVIAVPFHVLQEGRNELLESAAIIKWHQDNDLWDYPMSYYQNNGLQVIDWEHFTKEDE
jgi:hypothetical protein